MLKYEHVNVAVSRTNILNDINITFPKGQITTIIGPNGCGKTTLLQCLNGCSKVTAGTITVDNENILSLPLKERAKRIAFLPQIRTVIPVLPVRTLVEHGRFPYLGFTRRKTDKDNEIVNNSMEFTNVMPYSEDNTDTLSGGIRQRVFFSMVNKLKKSGKTIILVLHDLSDAIRISDNLVIMNDRKIAISDTPANCLKTHIIEDVFHTTYKKFSDDEGDYYIFM